MPGNEQDHPNQSRGCKTVYFTQLKSCSSIQLYARITLLDSNNLYKLWPTGHLHAAVGRRGAIACRRHFLHDDPMGVSSCKGK